MTMFRRIEMIYPQEITRRAEGTLESGGVQSGFDGRRR